jgi:IS1 family transposase
MQDYYSIYTWAMDKQADVQREAAQRRLLRESRHINLRLRLPVLRRRADR